MKIDKKVNEIYNNVNNAIQSRNSRFWIKAVSIGVVAAAALFLFSYQWSDNWSNFIKEQQDELVKVYSGVQENYHSIATFDSTRFCGRFVGNLTGTRKGVLECFKEVNGVVSSVYKFVLG